MQKDKIRGSTLYMLTRIDRNRINRCTTWTILHYISRESGFALCTELADRVTRLEHGDLRRGQGTVKCTIRSWRCALAGKRTRRRHPGLALSLLSFHRGHVGEETEHRVTDLMGLRERKRDKNRMTPLDSISPVLNCCHVVKIKIRWGFLPWEFCTYGSPLL